jgi:hypothetical protein
VILAAGGGFLFLDERRFDVDALLGLIRRTIGPPRKPGTDPAP